MDDFPTAALFLGIFRKFYSFILFRCTVRSREKNHVNLKGWQNGRRRIDTEGRHVIYGVFV